MPMSSPPPVTESPRRLSGQDVVRIYQGRTKHRFAAYAAGPETLDWDARPSLFRHFQGAPLIPLPKVQADNFPAAPDAPCRPDLAALGALLHLSFGLTAWKTLGPDRWSVRANPSSGNLHPVEVYVLAAHLPGIADGLYHYLPERHALEFRAFHPSPFAARPALAVGLSTAMWREAWKYGERAFRYCQLDTGHALGALRYAAALLGWGLHEQARVGTTTLGALLGVDRVGDFPGRRPEVNREEAELLVSLTLGGEREDLAPARLLEVARSARWQGVATEIDRFPMYRWPLVEEVALATRRGDDSGLPPFVGPLRRAHPAARILGRRSAQRFDGEHVMSAAALVTLLEALPDPDGGRLSLLFFIHRVEGLEPGLYLLPRGGWGQVLLAGLAARRVSPALAGSHGLMQLQAMAPVELRRVARSLHCHQDIASSSCLAVGMLAPFGALVESEPAAYRDLLREAGVLGQVLYLEAEGLGLRGTGIGCFFDDPVHEAAAVDTGQFQALYHFTIGMPLDDPRIETTPAYPAGGEE